MLFKRTRSPSSGSVSTIAPEGRGELSLSVGRAHCSERVLQVVERPQRAPISHGLSKTVPRRPPEGGVTAYPDVLNLLLSFTYHSSGVPMLTTTRDWLARGLLLLLCMLVLPLHLMSEGDQIKGFIDSFGYGYEVRVAINGTAIPVIKGQGQQATRLFSIDHPMRESAPVEQQNIFVLREGENTLLIEFRKVEDTDVPLQVTLEVPDRYAKPLFHLKTVLHKSGKVEQKFFIEKTMPENFETIEVTDDSM